MSILGSSLRSTIISWEFPGECPNSGEKLSCVKVYKMMSLTERVLSLDADINDYRSEMKSASVTDERKNKLLDAITAARNNLTPLLKQHTAGEVNS